MKQGNYRKILLVALQLSVSLNAKSTNHLQQGGAYSAGLSSAVIAYPKAGYYQNQAHLTLFDSLYVEAYSAIPNRIKEFGNYSVFAAAPLLKGYTALQFNFFGYEHYNESKLGLAYALKLSEKFSGGVQINWLRTSLSEPYENYNQLIAEVGFSYKITPPLQWGVHIYNPNLSKPVDDIQEKPLAAIRTGIAYTPIEQATLLLELVQQLNYKTSFRAGVDLELSRNFTLQAGYNHTPKTLSIGLGFLSQSYRINLAADYHNLLGLTPHFSLGRYF